MKTTITAKNMVVTPGITNRITKKTATMEEKMAEIRLINRAKWQLIADTGMTEEQAHRYIEKQAMDRCITRRRVAQELLNEYQ